jgi:hypothetical protein
MKTKTQPQPQPIHLRVIRGAGNLVNAVSMLGVKILVAWCVWQGIKSAFKL